MTIETIALRGTRAEVLVPGEAAGDALTILRYTAPPHFVAGPPHRHAITVEVFHVLEGVLTVQLADSEVTLGAGDTISVPTETVHSFRNDTAEPAVFLVIASPPGLEQFLRELAPLLTERGPGGPPDPDRLAELARRFDQLPPPTGAPPLETT